MRFLSWDMTAQLAVNYVESAVLFGAVGAALQKALDRKWIRHYDRTLPTQNQNEENDE